MECLARTIAINITGDITRISTSPAHRQITFVLTNGHYSLAKDPDRAKSDPGRSKPKVPLIYQEDGINNLIKIYNGEFTYTITSQEFKKMRSKFLSGKWCFISIEKNRSTGKYETLEEAYVRIYEKQNILL